MVAKTPKEIYDIYRKGDPLTDEDLRVGRQHFQELADLAFASGPVFHLAAAEANRVYLAFDDFIQSRRQR